MEVDAGRYEAGDKHPGDSNRAVSPGDNIWESSLGDMLGRALD